MDRRFNLVGQIPLITLVALCVVTALLTNRFLSPLNLTNILVQSSIMAVIAIGMTFVIIGGGFDLSVGSTVALAGCIAAMTMVKFGIAAGVLGRDRLRRRDRRRQRPHHRKARRQSVHHHTWHDGIGARPRLSHYRRSAGRRRRHAVVLHRLRLRTPARHPLSRLGASVAARRTFLCHAHDALWTAHLCHRRQPRSGLPLRRAGRTHRRFDLCLVRRARGRLPVSCWPRDCNPASPPLASSTN